MTRTRFSRQTHQQSCQERTGGWVNGWVRRMTTLVADSAPSTNRTSPPTSSPPSTRCAADSEWSTTRRVEHRPRRHRHAELLRRARGGARGPGDAHDIVPNINRLASAIRAAAGGTVAWIRMTFEPDELATSWTAFLPVNGGPDGAATFSCDRTRRRRAIGCGRCSRSTIATSSSTSTASARSSRVRRTCRRCSTSGASTRWSSSARSRTCAANRRPVTR